MDIERYWSDALEANAEHLAAHFAPDAHIDWPCTNERFSVPEFVRVNCLYPGKWSGKVDRTVESDDTLISFARIWSADGEGVSFHVTSVFTLRGGLITSLTEYWSNDSQPPQWRLDLGIGQHIE